MPAVHCRRDNAGSVAGGSVVSGIVESGSVARGSVVSGIGERQRREIYRLHRRWRDTASQLTKNGRILANVLFDASTMAAAGRRLARGIVVEVDASTHGTSVV